MNHYTSIGVYLTFPADALPPCLLAAGVGDGDLRAGWFSGLREGDNTLLEIGAVVAPVLTTMGLVTGVPVVTTVGNGADVLDGKRCGLDG